MRVAAAFCGVFVLNYLAFWLVDNFIKTHFGDYSFALMLVWFLGNFCLVFKFRTKIGNFIYKAWGLTRFYHPLMLQLWYWLVNEDPDKEFPWLEGSSKGVRMKADLHSTLTFDQFKKKMILPDPKALMMMDWVQMVCNSGDTKQDLHNFFHKMTENQEITLADFMRLWEETRKPLRVFVLGGLGQGKSSLINAFFHPWVCQVGPKVCQQAEVAAGGLSCTGLLNMYALPRQLFSFTEKFNCVEVGDLPGASLDLEDMMAISQGLEVFDGQWHVGCVCDKKYTSRVDANLQITANVFCLAYHQALKEHSILVLTQADVKINAGNTSEHQEVTPEQADQFAKFKIQQLSAKIEERQGRGSNIERIASVSDCHVAADGHKPKLDELIKLINDTMEKMPSTMIKDKVQDPANAPYKDENIVKMEESHQRWAKCFVLVMVLFFLVVWLFGRSVCPPGKSNMGNLYAPRCQTDTCGLPYTIGDGPACACMDGYSGHISWPGPTGNCVPAKCNVVNSNHLPGHKCKCQKDFNGTINWTGSQSVGHCTYKCPPWHKLVDGKCQPQKCDEVPGAIDFHGGCRCGDGYKTLTPVTWSAGKVLGRCDPADCNIQGSNKSPGKTCKCMKGLKGLITWEGAKASGQCRPECSVPGFYVKGLDCIPLNCEGSIDGATGKGHCRCKYSWAMTKKLEWTGSNSTQQLIGECTFRKKPECRNFQVESDLRWEDGKWRGGCVPAPCRLQFTTGAGLSCACADGYTDGSAPLTWNDEGELTGQCHPARCDIHNAHGAGPACRCDEGYYEKPKISWSGSEAFGKCQEKDSGGGSGNVFFWFCCMFGIIVLL